MDEETRFGFETSTVREQAESEIHRENYREQVRIIKEEIRAKRDKTFWRKVFPWKITIERR